MHCRAGKPSVWRVASIVACVVGLSACGQSTPPTESAPTPFTANFQLYSAAAQARNDIIDAGGTVSELTLVDGQWTFDSSVDAVAPTARIEAPNASVSAPSSACSSNYNPPGSSYQGNTQCDLYSEAAAERQAMIDNEEIVGGLWLDPATLKWRFDWRPVLDP